ncbi:hypothetical protein TorRG33x02_032630 [Trema orientale]|uniref:Uncharacterized protein n=1 Tax=Trema orientale TaxID=63057 RepID=A0A2P5FTI1_TREOI|nr:hypothetical protein TorRG33x02_032630 [Trema orientale]
MIFSLICFSLVHSLSILSLSSLSFLQNIAHYYLVNNGIIQFFIAKSNFKIVKNSLQK